MSISPSNYNYTHTIQSRQSIQSIQKMAVQQMNYMDSILMKDMMMKMYWSMLDMDYATVQNMVFRTIKYVKFSSHADHDILKKLYTARVDLVFKRYDAAHNNLRDVYYKIISTLI